ELGEQRDDRGRRQRLRPLPPVVAEQREQQPGRPLRHWARRRPRLGYVVLEIAEVRGCAGHWELTEPSLTSGVRRRGIGSSYATGCPVVPRPKVPSSAASWRSAPPG